MKILGYRVRMYRNVEDSGFVELRDSLTCIVGKNQSGKTALLKALYKFNPFSPSPYDMRYEWPRGKRGARDPKQIVCEVHFQLDQSELDGLSTIAGQPITASTIHVTKDYAGNLEAMFPENPDLFPNRLHPNDIDAACDSLPKPHADAGSDFKDAADECLIEVRRLAREGRFSELGTLSSAHKGKLRGKFTPGNPQPAHQREEEHVGAYLTQLQQLGSILGDKLTLHQKAHDYLVSRLPTFVYMDDYKAFAGRANLDQLQTKKTTKGAQLTEEDETFIMILELAHLDLKTLVEQGQSQDRQIIHDRQIDLDDAARTLTRDVAGRWGQNNYEIEFRADGQKFFTNIEETEKRIGMIPLEEQSKGFQWFFSFDLHFMHDSRGTFKGCVLLLDEPGLHLHPGGQADLLKRLDAYSEDNTTIYTTHLPFLIDLREPARIKVISQKDGNAVVSEELGSSQAEEKLTLQAALGMRANQSYLVSERNLVVEGADDYWILTELSNVLLRAGRSCLPDDVMVSAAGSASDVVHLATFMIGQDLEVVALFDSDEAGKREETKLRTKWLTRYKDSRSKTILLGSALGEGDAVVTLEDLFPLDYYLEKVRVSHTDKFQKVGQEPAKFKVEAKGHFLPAIEKACEALGVQFNKGSVSKLIRKDLRTIEASKMPAGTADKANRLFEAIREAFGEKA